MSEFKVNEDMFGRYCRIPTDYSKENAHLQNGRCIRQQ